MTYRVQETSSGWIISHDSENIQFEGEPITFEEYKKLRDHPEKAKEHFKRNEKGKLVRIEKKEPKVDNPSRLLDK